MCSSDLGSTQSASSLFCRIRPTSVREPWRNSRPGFDVVAGTVVEAVVEGEMVERGVVGWEGVGEIVICTYYGEGVCHCGTERALRCAKTHNKGRVRWLALPL